MTQGTIHGVVGNLITISVNGPVSQNEMCMVTVNNSVQLLAEVIKVSGSLAFAQVYESTRGLKLGDVVEFQNHMLEVELGPGMLGKNFDGLQNNLDKKQGVFIQRGDYPVPLDRNTIFEWMPLAKAGESVDAGSWLGSVKENWIDHKIMVPFVLEGRYIIQSIAKAGKHHVQDVIATLQDQAGKEYPVSMLQRWPVKKPIKAYKEKPRPFKLLETGIRIIDTFNPMAEGGTGFIPGPFGCGKTVLQHAISKNAEADIIIFAACGERANEVVEIFTEFPELIDPRNGHHLMERTTIICNTSNMPVASREASVYTAMTIAEYYRAMGLRVLLLADSTSRWAQALREMSNRLEELPGPDAFPMDLGAIIGNFYSRAGTVYLNNGHQGSITFIGTVSPAGGNLKEPVTENTKKVARCFYALQQARADSKRYPAVDPVDSYSKYLEYPELMSWFHEHVDPDWIEKVLTLKNWLLRGREIYEQINILGDDGVPIDYHIVFWKSEIIDFVLMQQDAFDSIDSLCPLDRQRCMLNIVLKLCSADYTFEEHEEIAPYFKKIINALRQMNYSEFDSDAYRDFHAKVEAFADERRPR